MFPPRENKCFPDYFSSPTSWHPQSNLSLLWTGKDFSLCISSVQFSSLAQSCLTLCHPMNCNMPVLPVHHQLPEFTQTQVHWVGDASSHLILCHPLLLLPPIPTSIRSFPESTLHMRWPKYLSFTLSISPFNEHPGLVSFRMDWLDLLALQGLSRVFSNTTVQKHQFFVLGPNKRHDRLQGLR